MGRFNGSKKDLGKVVIRVVSILGVVGCIASGCGPNPSYDASDSYISSKGVRSGGSGKLATNCVSNNNVSWENDKVQQSADIVDKVAKDEKGNVIYSPLSLDMILGMMQFNSKGNVKEYMGNVLMSDNYDDFAKGYTKSILSDDNRKISNSIWVNKRKSLKGKYKKGVKKFYQAKIKNVNFNDREDVANKVNKWADKSTDGMIKEIIGPRDVDPGKLAILCNAVYMKGAWEEKLYEVESKSKFQGLDGKTEMIHFLKNKSDKYGYSENKYAEAVSMKLDNGNEFIAILPKDSIDFELWNLDINSLIEGDKLESGKYDITVTLPKIKYTTNINLTKILNDMGYGKIFSFNFNNMSGSESSLSNIIQSATIDLDENGVKAAAITVAIFDNAMVIEPEQKEEKIVNFNRPYCYIIRDSKTKTIWFMGKVVNVDGQEE